ncbi:11976_t:CDS:1, partial [Acaulospora colombiana]
MTNMIFDNEIIGSDEEEIDIEACSSNDSMSQDDAGGPRVTHRWSYRSHKNFLGSFRDNDEKKDSTKMDRYDPKLSRITFAVKSVLETSTASDLCVNIPPRVKIRDEYTSTNFDTSLIHFYTEEECLDEFMNSDESSLVADDMSDGNYFRFDLDNFTIYDNTKEAVDIWNQGKPQQIFWDGFIIEGESKLMCKKAFYANFSLSGFGIDFSDVEVMFQSCVNGE